MGIYFKSNYKHMRNTVLILLLLSLFSSCRNKDFDIKNLDNKILVLGHGGMGIAGTYPMNSFESIMKCLCLGADGTEIDVQMSKDSILVAFHEQDLSDCTDMKGKINSHKWDEIKNAKYTNLPYLDYKIVSLEELFSNISNLNKYYFTFDCKLYKNKDVDDKIFQKQFANAIKKLIEKYSINDNVFIESQSKTFLKQLKNIDSSYKLYIYSSFQDGLNIANDLDLYGITIASDDISKEQIEIAHDNNLRVTVWSINSRKGNTKAINKNPDHIQSDKIKNLVGLLK